MRYIQLADGLRMRFPGRDEEFDLGVEIGIVAALMQMEIREFSRALAPDNIDQARALAEKMGYRVVEGDSRDDGVEIMFQTGSVRPKLTLVHSRSDTAARSETEVAPSFRRTPARCDADMR